MTTYIWGEHYRSNPCGVVNAGMTKQKSPDCGWIKLNADGAAARDEDWLAVGGLHCDSNGD